MADVPFSDFGGSGIKQIIRSSGTVSVTGAGTFTQTVTIASVSTAKADLSLLTTIGFMVDSTASDGVISAKVELTSATVVTITVACPTSGSTFNVSIAFQVIEYY